MAGPIRSSLLRFHLFGLFVMLLELILVLTQKKVIYRGNLNLMFRSRETIYCVGL